MSLPSDMEEYYQKVIQLQEKLRQSEEERLKLEMKFNEMLQLMKEEEEAHFKKLRSKYKQFLEEDRRRQQRNDKILEALDRIENRTVMWEAKTEKFKTFRKRYQDYLKAGGQSSRTPLSTEKLPVARSGLSEYPPDTRTRFYESNRTGESGDVKDDIMKKYLQSLSSQKCKEDILQRKSSDNLLPESKYSNLGNINSVYWKTPRNTEKNEMEKENRFQEKYGSAPLKTTKDFENSLKQSENALVSTSSKVDFSESGSARLLCRDYDDPVLSHQKPSSELLSRREFTSSSNTQQPVCYTGDASRRSQQMLGNRPKEFEIYKQPGQSPQQVHSDLEHLLKQHKDDAGTNETYPLQTTETLQSLQNQFSDISDTACHHEQYNSPPNYQIPSTSATDIQPALNQHLQPAVRQASSTSATSDLHDIGKPSLGSLRYMGEAEEVLKVSDISSGISKVSGSLPASNNVMRAPVEGGKNFDSFVSTSGEEGTLYGSVKDNTMSQDEPAMKQLEEDPKMEGRRLSEQKEQFHKAGEHPLKPFSYAEEKQQIYQKPEKLEETLHQQQLDSADNFRRLQPWNVSGQKSLEDRHNISEIPPVSATNEQVEQCYPTKEETQPAEHYDVTGQPLQPYGIGEQSLQGDENHQYMQQYYDGNGKLSQQYAENGQVFQQYYDKIGQPFQNSVDGGLPRPPYYDENRQPLQQYYENEQLLQQYDKSEQPLQQCDQNGQPLGQYNESWQQLQQYDENGQSLGQYDESGQQLQQYDQNGQQLGQYNESGQQLQQYDEHGQPLGQYDESAQQLQQQDENGQLLQQYDKNGQPLWQYDEKGQPLQNCDEDRQSSQQFYDDSEQLVQEYDANGQPIPQYGANGQYEQNVSARYGQNGQPIVHFDETWQPLPNCAEIGQPILQYDESGQPLEQYYDENGQSVQYYGEADAQQYDENGQLIHPQYNEQSYEDQQQYSDQQQDLGQQQQVKEQEEPAHQQEQEQHQVEQPNAAAKPNVLELLDTDTESAKQDTKVSNDSDFDFSNG